MERFDSAFQKFTPSEAVPLATALANSQAIKLGIRGLLIKGPLATHQNLRSDRTSADVDVLVEPNRVSDYLEAFRARGWTQRYDFPDHPKIVAPHSVTLVHPEWPCDLDIHYRWPGFFTDPASAFEKLWSERINLSLAHQQILTPSWRHHALIVALHSLRTPGSINGANDLALVVKSLNDTLSTSEKLEFASELEALGASEAGAPLLKAIGAEIQEPGIPSDEFLAWKLSGESAGLKGVGWAIALRQAKLADRPRIIFRAVFPSLESLRTGYPELSHHALWPLRIWAKRLSVGISDLKAVRKTVRKVKREH